MKNKILLFVCALLFSAGAWAQYDYAFPEDMEQFEEAPKKAAVPRFYRYYYAVGCGISAPVGGRWGDKDAGFRSSPAWSFAGAKKVDDILSYGIESSYDTGHKHRTLNEMGVRLFSFTPFIRFAHGYGRSAYYAILGAGVYHWSQPAFGSAGTGRPSDSGSSLGVSMGGGAVYPFGGALNFGFDLRWRHIFSVNGANFDADLINNIVPSIMFYYGFINTP
ncbi:MAG: hypothetical protein KKH28_12095 [Elusimicrobia bacterium]|nr:hypothetical protein [Elusimicrobiota bacterium]